MPAGLPIFLSPKDSSMPGDSRHTKIRMNRGGLTSCLYILALCCQASSASHSSLARHGVAFQMPARMRRIIGAVRERMQEPNTRLVDAAEDVDNRWQRFGDWAGSRGVRFNRWQVGDVGGGLRGAVATESIKEGSVMVSAPKDAVISCREADACPLPKSFIDPAYWDSMAKKWEMRMALLLLYEKQLGPESKWATYFDVLPSSFGLPLTFSEEELRQLQFAPFISDLVCEREFWGLELEKLATAMPHPPSRAELMWALSCVCSRTFTCEYEGKLPPAQVCLLFSQQKSLCMVVLSDAKLTIRHASSAPRMSVCVCVSVNTCIHISVYCCV